MCFYPSCHITCGYVGFDRGCRKLVTGQGGVGVQVDTTGKINKTLFCTVKNFKTIVFVF